MMNDPVLAGTLFSLFFVVVATAGTALAIFLFGRGKDAIPIGWLGRTAILVALVTVAWMLFYSPVFTLHQASPHTHESGIMPDDEKLLKMGKNLFNVHCGICHGEAGDAPKGKGANLTHRISFESALLNIQRGANNFRHAFPGGMPPMISDRLRAAQVAHYVSSGFTENEEGKMLYRMINCARCHGEDGRGLQYMGPNIREFDLKTVALVLRHGKNGVIGKMPRFEQLSDEQIRALGLYVISLGEK